MSDGLSTAVTSPIDTLLALYKKYSKPDWDGYLANPITQATHLNAEQFLEQLMSQGLPVPSFSPTPDGRIKFEWKAPNEDLYGLSIGDESVVRYTQITSGTRRSENGIHHGVVNIDNLEEVIKSINATLKLSE